MGYVINILKKEIERQNIFLDSIKNNKEIANFGMTMNLIDESEVIKRDCELAISIIEKQKETFTIEIEKYNKYYADKNKTFYDKLKEIPYKFIFKFK